jgi:hypothetical protein
MMVVAREVMIHGEDWRRCDAIYHARRRERQRERDEQRERAGTREREHLK